MVDLNKVYKPSEDVVARDVHGEFIIIPMVSGIGDGDEEVFSLNACGRAVWISLDGKKTLKDIAGDLTKKYDVTLEQLERDLVGIVGVLLEKKMLVQG